jgi:hypothetical protein
MVLEASVRGLLYLDDETTLWRISHLAPVGDGWGIGPSAMQDRGYGLPRISPFLGTWVNKRLRQ